MTSREQDLLLSLLDTQFINDILTRTNWQDKWVKKLWKMPALQTWVYSALTLEIHSWCQHFKCLGWPNGHNARVCPQARTQRLWEIFIPPLWLRWSVAFLQGSLLVRRLPVGMQGSEQKSSIAKQRNQALMLMHGRKANHFLVSESAYFTDWSAGLCGLLT